jgi:hypothetical protein
VHPELRADSRYNRDNAYITGHYALSSDTFAVIIKTGKEGCLKYQTLVEADRLAWTLQQVPGVQTTVSLANAVRQITAGSNEGAPKWLTIARNQDVLNYGAQQASVNNPDLFNTECSVMPVIAYLSDHRAETLDRVVQAAGEFAQAHNAPDRQFLLAAGSAGIEAATNIVVRKAWVQMLFMVYAAVIVLCFITFRSWRAVVVAVVPLVITSVLCEALMVALGIGVKVATLPVVALGVGIGVDYALYLVSVQLAQQRSGVSLAQAYRVSLQFTGKVVVLVGVTLAAGVATWALSPIKFQADMGILLAFMFVWNMIGAVVLIPALSHFLLNPRAERAAAHEPSLIQAGMRQLSESSWRELLLRSSLCPLARARSRQVSRCVGLDGAGCRRRVSVRALRRIVDAVRVAARHGPELPVDRGPLRPGHPVLGQYATALGRRAPGCSHNAGADNGAGPVADRDSGRFGGADHGVRHIAGPPAGLSNRFGVLTGGAVAICGASAAMAIAAVIPVRDEDSAKERATIFTVIGVSTLSTVAMVIYPMIVTALGLDSAQSGIFLGGTIHDVAQVVGAGYGMSKETGDVATIVKLLRVAMLLPVILIITLAYRKQQPEREAGAPKPPLLPWFVVAFAILVAINSVGLIPAVVQKGLQTLSTWLLVIAMSAIGMKSHMKEVASVGIQADLADGERDRVHRAAGRCVHVPGCPLKLQQ